MDTSPAPLEAYPNITITPLKGRSTRVDVEVRDTLPAPASFATTDIVGQLRKFFDALEQEAAERKTDPIAMVTALANLDALLADVRFVRDTVRKHAAEALVANDVRRLAIEGVAAVEASSTLDRKWEDGKLMTEMLHRQFPNGLVDPATGEQWSPDTMAECILAWFGISYWRMGALKPAGIDPDQYSEFPTGEDGKPARQPAVTMKVNTVRRSRA